MAAMLGRCKAGAAVVRGSRMMQVSSLPLVRRAPVSVRATEEEAAPKLDFTPNIQGYVEKDSAGQTNMFPDVAKAYEAGSSADKSDDATNTGVAVGAAAVALSLVAAGLFAATQGPSASLEVEPPAGSFLTLSAYKDKFQAELAPVAKPAPAPAPSLVEPAAPAAPGPSLVEPAAPAVEEESAPAPDVPVTALEL